jgi:hypothetical protein
MLNFGRACTVPQNPSKPEQNPAKNAAVDVFNMLTSFLNKTLWLGLHRTKK